MYCICTDFPENVDVSVCDELAEVSHYEYFFEGLLHFATRGNFLTPAQRRRLRENDDKFYKSIFLLGKKRKCSPDESIRAAPEERGTAEGGSLSTF